MGAARAEAAMAAWAAAARDREGAWEGGGSDRGVGCDGCFVRDAHRVGVRHEQSEPEHGRLHICVYPALETESTPKDKQESRRVKKKHF